MKRSRISKTLEKIEIWLEDIVIGILSIVSILLIVAMVIYIKGNQTVSSIPLYQKITMLGYGLLPWIVMISLISISRDLWIIRRRQEKK